MSEYKVLGRDIPRIDGAPKASGGAKYTADIHLPETLCGRILRSRHPHARILNLDTRKAERLPGVKAVISSKNTPDIHYGVTIFDQRLFDPEKVRYLGDEIAAVAATDPDIELAEEDSNSLDLQGPASPLRDEALQRSYRTRF